MRTTQHSGVAAPDAVRSVGRASTADDTKAGAPKPQRQSSNAGSAGLHLRDRSRRPVLRSQRPMAANISRSFTHRMNHKFCSPRRAGRGPSSCGRGRSAHLRLPRRQRLLLPRHPHRLPHPLHRLQVAPTAYPAKIALIAFEQAVIATNEGQQTRRTNAQEVSSRRRTRSRRCSRDRHAEEEAAGRAGNA